MHRPNHVTQTDRASGGIAFHSVRCIHLNGSTGALSSHCAVGLLNLDEPSRRVRENRTGNAIDADVASSRRVHGSHRLVHEDLPAGGLEPAFPARILYPNRTASGKTPQRAADRANFNIATARPDLSRASH